MLEVHPAAAAATQRCDCEETHLVSGDGPGEILAQHTVNGIYSSAAAAAAASGERLSVRWSVFVCIRDDE